MIDRRFARCLALLAGLAIVMLAAAACSTPRDPLIVEDGLIAVENQTSREWRNVTIRVNDHFTGGVPVLAAGGHVNASLSQFQTSLGQKFDRARQNLYKVEVTATDADGKQVVLAWRPDQQKK
jgi:hypothetical protein